MPGQSARFRTLGTISLVIPAIVLLLVIGIELLDGNLGAAIHLLEIAVLAAVGWAAWRWPFTVGQLLMLGGALLAIAWVLFLHPAGVTLLSVAIVELVLFMPVVIAGALFTLSGALLRRDGATNE
ncbi:MAG: hypothetical protein DWI48_03790 [Chloroflexi bacterium]|nr:MAG: hypothetical protein DWI48_03790 [Chloroflexota bacterium]